jgi:hypothetical protein
MSLREQLVSAGASARVRQIPVSRASFLLTDREAFETAVGAAAIWIEKTAAAQLPDDARRAGEFDFDAPDGRAHASALRISNDEGEIWAARVSYFGDQVVGREWITDLFVERRHGVFVRFGAQLNCRCPHDDPGFDHSRPRIVRDVLESLAAEEDGESLTNHVEAIEFDDVDRLVSLLYQPGRRLPVVLVSTDETGGAQIDLKVLANRLSGTAHLRCISTEPSFELTRQIGKRLSTFSGAIRVYMPGLEQETEDPFQHPLWLCPPSGRNPRALAQIAARILPLGFRDPEGDRRFWQVALLRQSQSRALADRKEGSREEQLEAELEALRSENAVLRDNAESAETLMYEEASKLSATQADTQRLEEENYTLRERIRSLKNAGTTNIHSVDEGDIWSLFEQDPSLETSLRIIAAVFADRVIVLDTAFESAQDSGVFRHKKKAFTLLWTLCTDYWNALVSGDGDAEARRFLGASYAAKESETLSGGGRKRRTFTYRGAQILMEKHLKIGVADNRAETLRVHFEWLAELKQIVIGYCGGHLDF